MFSGILRKDRVWWKQVMVGCMWIDLGCQGDDWDHTLDWWPPLTTHRWSCQWWGVIIMIVTVKIDLLAEWPISDLFFDWFGLVVCMYEASFSGRPFFTQLHKYGNSTGNNSALNFSVSYLAATSSLFTPELQNWRKIDNCNNDSIICKLMWRHGSVQHFLWTKKVGDKSDRALACNRGLFLVILEYWICHVNIKSFAFLWS